MSEYDVTLDGGRPWGIRIQGGRGSSFPLRLAHVTEKSKGALNGLIAGMNILQINDNVTDEMSMHESRKLIVETGPSLKLRVRNDYVGTGPTVQSNGKSEGVASPITSPMTSHVVLEGGKPWGLRLMGGKDVEKKLKIGAVTQGSKAQGAGLLDGDVLLSINDIKTDSLKRVDAENIIKDSGDQLKLEISRVYDALPSPLPMSPPGKIVEHVEEEGPSRSKAFSAELEQFVSGEKKLSGFQQAKGNTFLMMKDHLDAGIGGKILSVFDVEPDKRNQAVPTTAPKVNKQDSLDSGTNSGGLTRTVVMSGGGPWGFRIKGGVQCGAPLAIASVTVGSTAFNEGLLEDDNIVTINERNIEDLSMIECQDLIQFSGEELRLVICKPGIRRLDEGVDKNFLDDIKKSMAAANRPKGARSSQGMTFKKLQSIVD